MQRRVLNAEEFKKLVTSLANAQELDYDFLFDVYESVNETINEIVEKNDKIKFNAINPVVVTLYILNEYLYITSNKSAEEKKYLVNNDEFFNSLASTCADKYLTNEQLNVKSLSFLNKFNPQVSTLELYLNFTLTSLNNFKINNKYTSLISDMLKKAFNLSKCILNLLVDGFETEAFSTWRTLHENECILTCLIKYGENTFNSYFRHVTYALAYRGQIQNKEEVDQIFIEIKDEMKKHDLKSKDMKKFIEYGYLFSIPDIKLNEDFKLNFRDGVEKLAGLEAYSKVYEMSSEISHSSPLLLFSNREYYFLITLLNLYETFFRLEVVFSQYYMLCTNKEIFEKYILMKKTYLNQLLNIHKEIEGKLVNLRISEK